MPGEMWDTTVISSPSAIEDWTMVVRGKQQEMSAKPARIHHHHHSQSLFGIISDNDYYTSPLRLRGDWNLDNYKNISDREDDGHGGEIVMGCTDGLVTTGGAPLNEGQISSPSGRPALPGSHPSSTSGSVSKASPVPADCYWFAQGGEAPSENRHLLEGLDADGREGTSQEKEDRMRQTRERQAEERIKKLEEIKSAAIQAQKFREVQEEERRRKIEEIKAKDIERRHLVEERKKQIWEAEKERRETILRKSQEREAKIEAKKNAQRSSIGFAFGSSIPRSLDLEALGIGRRSSSQGNVTPQLTASYGGGTDSKDRGDTEVIRRRTSSSYALENRSAHRHTIHEAFFGEGPSLGPDHISSPTSNGTGQNGSPPQPSRSISSLDLPWGTDLDLLTPVQPRDVDCRLSGVLTGSGVLVGENLMTQSLTSLTGATHRGRRKTDLIPTIPSNRDSPRTRSPGRAYSMTRLDQLSQPKRRQLEALREERNATSSSPGMIKTKSMTHLAWRKGTGKNGLDGRGLGSSRASADPQMSKSTSHLAVTSSSSSRSSPTRMNLLSGSTSPRHSLRGSSPAASEGNTKRLSQSMWQLSTPSVVPRPTRAFALRRNALAQSQQKGISLSMMHLVPTSNDRDGTSRARSSPSRPQSSMSQMSLSSHASQNSSISVRARSAPRRPRPLSVAGSVPDKKKATSDERQSRSSEKKTPAPTSITGKPPRAKSVGAEQAVKDGVTTESDKPLVTTPMPMPRRLPPSGSRTLSSKVAPKEKNKAMAKPIPPDHEVGKTTLDEPQAQEDIPDEAEGMPPAAANHDELKPENLTTDTVPETKTAEEDEDVKLDVVIVPDESAVIRDEFIEQEVTSSSEVVKEEVMVETAEADSTELPLPQVPHVQHSDPEPPQQVPVVSTTSGLSSQVEEVAPAAAVVEAIPAPVKTKITTEEEAKAALAEKRRLAREQAEREAELERQRQEELRRQEEERLRREEEANRLWEQEQEAARLAEEERLRLAIEEQQKREEEERLRKEEETRQKIEKEKAEKQAREEQEKIRKETEEKLRKEEEERAERRRRVEAIMSRTRGKGGNNTPPVTTPTKSVEPAVALAENKVGTATVSLISSSAEQNLKDDRPGQEEAERVTEHQSTVVGNGLAEEKLTEIAEVRETTHRIEQTEDDIVKESLVVENVHTNGFTRTEIISNQVNTTFIVDNQSTEKKASLLSPDLSEFDLLTPKHDSSPPKQSDVAQLIDLSLGTFHSSTTSEITTTRNELVEHISNEDNVNFNITSNGVDSPFVDNYTKCQDSLTDFLS